MHFVEQHESEIPKKLHCEILMAANRFYAKELGFEDQLMPQDKPLPRIIDSISENNKEKLEEYIKEGDDINIYSSLPLVFAIEEKKWEIVDLLVNKYKAKVPPAVIHFVEQHESEIPKKLRCEILMAVIKYINTYPIC